MVQRRAIVFVLLLVTVPTPTCSQCTTCNQQPSQIYYNSQVAVQPANNGRPAGYVNIQFQPPSSVSRNQQIYVWYGNPQPVQNQNNGVQPQYNPNGYNNNNNQQPVMYNNINRDQPNYANQPQPYNPNVPQQTPRPNQSIPGFLPPAGVPSTAFPYSTTTPAYNTVGPLAPINQAFDQPPTYLNTGSTPTPAPYYGSTTAAPPVYSPSTTAFPYSTQFNQGTPMPTGTASPYYSSTMSPSTTPFYPSTTTMAPPTSTFPSTTTPPMYTSSTGQPQFTNTLQPSQQLQQQPYVQQQQQQQQPSTFAPYSSTQGPTTTTPVQIGYNPAGQPVYGQPTSTQAPFVSTTPTTPYAQSTTPYGSQYPMTGTPVNQGAIGVNNMNNAPGSTPYYPSTTPSPQQPFYSPSTTQQPFVQGPTTTSPGVYQIGQGVPGVPNTANPQFNPPQNVQSSTYSPYAAGGSTLGTQQMYDPSTGLVTANGMNTMYGRYTTMEPGSQMMRDVPINGGATLSLAAGMVALLFLF